MTCGGCGNEKAFKTVSGNGWEYCDRCGDFKSSATVDVFWDGTAEHGLPDDPKTGQPRVFGSKGEKAAFLRANGLTEAGDRTRGAPTSVLDNRAPADRGVPAAEALRIVREMGSDRRRQELYRIQKESGRR